MSAAPIPDAADGRRNAAATLRKRLGEIHAAIRKRRPGEGLSPISRAVDDYFEEAFTASPSGPFLEINRNPYAIIALGGYGREELNLRSDIDLLFLFRREVPAGAESLIREMIYPLWDLGLEVGYALRSLGDCLSLAGSDFQILTPLLDARFVCGVSVLYSELLERLRAELRRRRGWVVEKLVEHTRLRHERFGDSAHLLEPHLKEGQGGLRDYHSLRWAARLDHEVLQPRDLEYTGLLSHGEFTELWDALQFIWAVRDHLHEICRRRVDRLHFEHQLAIADRLGYPAAGGQQPVERFLGELHRHMEGIKRLHLACMRELAAPKKRRRMPAASLPEGIVAAPGGFLGFESAEAILKRPELLIRIFTESARSGLPLAGEARRLLREFLHLVDAPLRTAPAVVRALESLLVHPQRSEALLDELLASGLLEALIPELHGVAHRIQYDEYHVYPVDRHLLHTVIALQQLALRPATGVDDLPARIYRELPRKALLHWAALLHDIGKADPAPGHAARGAELVRRLLAERGFSPEDRETAAFLVREHLLLIQTATRRDIHDEETALACARRIPGPEALKMLYLLTVADARATGPAAWSDWTAHLLQEFFLKVLHVIEEGDLASRRTVEAIERKRQELLAGAASGTERRRFAELFPFLSPRYLLAMDPSEIAAHIALASRLGERPFVWDIQPAAGGKARRLTVCAKDRPGLMASLAGVFTLNGINILDVLVFTWRNGLALDRFELSPPPDPIFEEERWQRAADHLEAVLAGKLDLAAVLAPRLEAARAAVRPRAGRKPHRVQIDNASSSFFTILEVFTQDFPGLLYCIADALHRHGLDIRVAKIATQVDQVVDVFYVRDLAGGKLLEPARIAALEREILERLAPSEPPRKGASNP
ncbi:MAG: [protein-PII] uridylyltransferase [Desulfobacterales bacterium]